jgi:hypothetical protein
LKKKKQNKKLKMENLEKTQIAADIIIETMHLYESMGSDEMSPHTSDSDDFNLLNLNLLNGSNWDELFEFFKRNKSFFIILVLFIIYTTFAIIVVFRNPLKGAFIYLNILIDRPLFKRKYVREKRQGYLEIKKTFESLEEKRAYKKQQRDNGYLYGDLCVALRDKYSFSKNEQFPTSDSFDKILKEYQSKQKITQIKKKTGFDIYNY